MKPQMKPHLNEATPMINFLPGKLIYGTFHSQDSELNKQQEGNEKVLMLSSFIIVWSINIISSALHNFNSHLKRLEKKE